MLDSRIFQVPPRLADENLIPVRSPRRNIFRTVSGWDRRRCAASATVSSSSSRLVVSGFGALIIGLLTAFPFLKHFHLAIRPVELDALGEKISRRLTPSASAIACAVSGLQVVR
jgi:hypothetical protein